MYFISENKYLKFKIKIPDSCWENSEKLQGATLFRRTWYSTAAVDKPVRSTSLYHCRQCCKFILKSRSDRTDYTVVCFMTHDFSRKLPKHSTTSASWVWF